MKEKVWIHIPKNFQRYLQPWIGYFSYETEDEDLGRSVAYSFITNNKKYENLIDLLKKQNIRYFIFRREYLFSKTEIENSEILKLKVFANAKNSYSSDHEGNICSACGEKVQKLYRHKLHVDYKNIRKYDISVTYSGDTEIIISDKVKDLMIKEKISGIEFYPVFQLGSENQVINNFFHLKLSEGIGEVVEPSIVDRTEKKCSQCGFYKKFLCQTPLYFKRETWKQDDICYTLNWFGSPPYAQGKWVIISQRLYRILKDNKINFFSVEPSFFI